MGYVFYILCTTLFGGGAEVSDSGARHEPLNPMYLALTLTNSHQAWCRLPFGDSNCGCEVSGINRLGDRRAEC